MGDRLRQVSYASVSLAFQMVWATNLAFVPPFLEYLGARPGLIGVLLSLAPIVQLSVQWVVSHLSNRTGTRWPYIVGGAVAAAGALVGLSRSASVMMAGACFLLECLAVQTMMVPYRALLTDVFPADRYVSTTTLQSLFKEVGNLTCFTVGALLLRMDRGYPFVGTAVAVLACSIWACSQMWRMRPLRGEAAGAEAMPAAVPARRWMYAAQGLWWFAIYVMTAFTVLFVVHVVYGLADLHADVSQHATTRAMWLLMEANVVGLLAAMPVSRLAERIGTRQGLMVGVLFLFAASVLALGVGRGDLALVTACCTLYGIGLAAIQVLSYPVVVEMLEGVPSTEIARIYGVLMAAPELLAMLGGGWACDLTHSYRTAYLLAAVALAGAAFCLRRVSYR